MYEDRLEVCEGVIAAAVEEIVARCDQETQGYEAATYKYAVIPSESVKDSNITTSSHVACTVQEQTTIPVYTKVKATTSLYTGGDTLQLPPPVQTPMNEDWRGNGARP